MSNALSNSIKPNFFAAHRIWANSSIFWINILNNHLINVSNGTSHYPEFNPHTCRHEMDCHWWKNGDLNHWFAICRIKDVNYCCAICRIKEWKCKLLFRQPMLFPGIFLGGSPESVNPRKKIKRNNNFIIRKLPRPNTCGESTTSRINTIRHLSNRRMKI